MTVAIRPLHSEPGEDKTVDRPVGSKLKCPVFVAHDMSGSKVN